MISLPDYQIERRAHLHRCAIRRQIVLVLLSLLCLLAGIAQVTLH